MTGTQPPVRIAVPIPLTLSPRRRNTLEWLRASRIALLVLDALLLVAVLVSTNIHHTALKTIGVDSAPSIIHAQTIKVALADMDAQAANELLGASGTVAGAVAAYEADRKSASKALIEAARNITYRDEEPPILTLQVALGDYERLIQQARDLHQRGDPAAVTAYRAAAAVMDTQLLPAADALDEANNKRLIEAYGGQAVRSTAARAFVMLTGLLSVVVLLAIQIFLSRRTRRTFNPLLLAATLLAFGFTAYALSAFETEHAKLKIAREEAFTSIHALWLAKAVAFEANGLESRYLLDTAHAAELERAFHAETHLLAHLPEGTQPDAALTALRRGGQVDGFKGYLADELNNITFDGERDAALRTLSTWDAYLDIDAQLRRLARAGKTQEAIALCVGSAANQSDGAFNEFTQALDAKLQLNQDAFDQAVKAGFAALDAMDVKASIAAVLIALLSVLGLQPRMREYQ